MRERGVQSYIYVLFSLIRSTFVFPFTSDNVEATLDPDPVGPDPRFVLAYRVMDMVHSLFLNKFSGTVVDSFRFQLFSCSVFHSIEPSKCITIRPYHKGLASR